MKTITILSELIDWIHYLANIVEDSENTTNTFERLMIDYVYHETKMCKSYIARYPILKKNFTYLFEDEKEVEEENEKHLEEEKDEKLPDEEEDDKENDLDDSKTDIQQIRDFCKDNKDAFEDFETRHSGLTLYGKAKFENICKYLKDRKTIK